MDKNDLKLKEKKKAKEERKRVKKEEKEKKAEERQSTKYCMCNQPGSSVHAQTRRSEKTHGVHVRQ